MAGEKIWGLVGLLAEAFNAVCSGQAPRAFPSEFWGLGDSEGSPDSDIHRPELGLPDARRQGSFSGEGGGRLIPQCSGPPAPHAEQDPLPSSSPSPSPSPLPLPFQPSSQVCNGISCVFNLHFPDDRRGASLHVLTWVKCLFEPFALFLTNCCFLIAFLA